MTEEPQDIISVADLTLNFGSLAAVSDVSLRIGAGELVGLIGPNGAGKTTLFNLLTGVYAPSSGTITFRSGGQTHQLGTMKPYAICRRGIARTFQNIRLFKDLSVLDNVKIALQQNVPYGLAASVLRLPSHRRGEQRILEESLKILEIMGLGEKAGDLARNLSYGDQRHLEIARALATKPTLLLLDEPAAGMNPAETTQLTDLITWLRTTFGLTVLLIEHDMSLVMRICERIYVLDHGVVISSGTPAEVRSDPRVIEAYLGEEVSGV